LVVIKRYYNFVKGFDKSYALNVNTIASLKRRPLNKKRLLVNNDPKVIEFVKYVKDRIKDFENESFMNQGIPKGKGIPKEKISKVK
jgi:hypothetical protein